MQAVCTGYGASDTHALILNNGNANTHSSAGQPYQTISADEIVALIANPPTVAKEAGQWIIPSAYHQHDARSHAAQRLQGSFAWMAADIDRGSPSLAAVLEACRLTFGDAVYFAVYSSRSAKPGELKWRVLVPLAAPLTGTEYGAYQAAFFDSLEKAGLEVDRTLERTGQLVYLPNRGEHYEFHFEPGQLLDPRAHPMSRRASQYLEVQAAVSAGVAKQEGARSHLAAFRRKHPIADLLAAYGYANKPGTDHWRSPLSQSGSYSTQDRGDHWISLSHNDAAAGLGKATANGSRYGDAFDLYVYYSCGGNREQAELYAKECLKQEDDARYGEATAAHGRDVWFGLVSIGDKLGPAGHKQAMAEAALKVEELKTPEPEIIDEEHDWDVEWPPGIAGEMAKHIYRSSSRPVKQYSIAMALYILAGMAGQRYNVEGFGINLYMALVGNSGTGKGEARRHAKRIYGAVGMAAQDPQGIANVFDHSFPASGAGLRKMFDEANGTRAVYLEDADAVIESLTNAQPGSNGDLLRASLSQFYDQSGAGLNLGAVRYAKEEDSTGMVSSPSLTLGFDLQVDPFKRFLGHGVVLTTGIGARFLYIIRYGKRMFSQKNRRAEMPEAMIEHMKLIWNGIRTQANTTTDVGWTKGAHEAFIEMDDSMTRRIREGRPEEDLLNRAHMNAARVAAALAIGINQINPVIDESLFAWARKFVLKGYDECLKLMAAGEVGSGERVRVAKAVQAIQEYIKMPIGRRHVSYRVPKGLDTLDDVICEKYFLTRLSPLQDFKGTDNGLTTEDIIRRTIQELVRQEYLIESDRAKVCELKGVVLHNNIRQPLYLIGPSL